MKDRPRFIFTISHMKFTRNTMLVYEQAMYIRDFVSRQDTTVIMTEDTKAPNQPRTILFGKSEYTFPSDELRPLRDSSDVLGDAEAMRERLAEDGFLYLPGFLDREEVLAARREILAYMEEQGGLEPDSRPLDGVMGQYGKGVPMMGRKLITHRDAVSRVLAAQRLYELHEMIQGEPVTTYEYKWLRAVGNEEFTGAHMDHVYMGRGSKRLMTVWIPLADIPVEQGTLCIVPATHRLPEFEKLRNTYGRMDVDRDRTEGWFTKKPREITDTFGGCWHTTNIQAGDVITFGMHLMHASTTNLTDKWRISCDVRFQPSADQIDPRWAGKEPKGHRPAPDERPMAEARAEWGI